MSASPACLLALWALLPTLALAGEGQDPAAAKGPRLWSIAHAESLMARFPDPDSIPHRAWCYTQGYILTGFDRLYERTGDQRYFDYVKRFVDQHVDSSGGVRGFRGNSLDDMMAGAAIVSVYRRTGENHYKLAADRVRDAFRDYPRNPDGGFLHAKNPAMAGEMWIDGVFMGGTFLLAYGQHVGDREASYAEVARQIRILASRCRKGKSRLFLHAYDADKNAAWADPATGLSPEVWSEGLGWYALVVVEALAALPADHRERPALLAIFRELSEGLRLTQDPANGLWLQVVDKGSQPGNWHDSSGSAMFLYALQRGIDLALLERDRFLPVVRKGWVGLLTKVTLNERFSLVDIHDACDGLGVQRSYADYVGYPRRINAKETLGSFLWASIEIEKPGRR